MFLDGEESETFALDALACGDEECESDMVKSGLTFLARDLPSQPLRVATTSAPNPEASRTALLKGNVVLSIQDARKLYRLTEAHHQSQRSLLPEGETVGNGPFWLQAKPNDPADYVNGPMGWDDIEKNEGLVVATLVCLYFPVNEVAYLATGGGGVYVTPCCNSEGSSAACWNACLSSHGDPYLS